MALDGTTHVRLWSERSRVAKYSAFDGWLDAGERACLSAVADEVRGRNILDVGVGGGRTTPLLRLLTDEYVGMDWSADMVAASRAAFPGLDLRVGDARDLSQFADGSFSLVFFSYNGIDNLGHDDRLLVIGNVWRVLQPRGFFVYSTLSKLGPLYRHRPSLWASREPHEPAGRFAARALYTAATRAPRHRARLEAWRHGVASAEDHDGWGLAPLEALDFALQHFTTIEAESRALAAAGFETVSVVSRDGEPLGRDEPTGLWFHVVARKSSGV